MDFREGGGKQWRHKYLGHLLAVQSHAYWRDSVPPSQGRPTPLLSLQILVEFSLSDRGSVLRSAAASGILFDPCCHLR